MPAPPRLSSTSGLVALLAGIGATSGSCAGGHACSPESSRLDEQQQRDMRDDGEGVGAGSGTAQPTDLVSGHRRRSAPLGIHGETNITTRLKGEAGSLVAVVWLPGRGRPEAARVAGLEEE